MSAMDKVITLSKQIEAKRVEIKAMEEEMAAALREAGMGTMGQDGETGSVYKVVRPDGRFVTFPEIGYVRTRVKAAGEKTGSLSLTDAREAGFTVE